MEAVILDFTGHCLRAVVGLLNGEGGRFRLVMGEARDPGRVRAGLCGSILPNPSDGILCTADSDPSIVSIQVQAGRRKPYFIASEGQERGVWRWGADETEPVWQNPGSVRDMIRATGGSVYEARRSLKQTLTHDGLRLALAAKELPLGRPQRVTLGLVDEQGFYTNLAWILSDQRLFRLELLWIQGVESMGKVLERETILVPFMELCGQARREMLRLMRRRGVDDAAWLTGRLEEALRQAFQLMDFSAEEGLSFCVYNNRLVIQGRGGPPESVTHAGLCRGETSCRNKRLLQVLARVWGSDSAGLAAFHALSEDVAVTYDGMRFFITVSRVPQVAEESGMVRGNAAKAAALMMGKPYISKEEVAEHLRLSTRRACLLLNRMEKEKLVICLIPNSLYRLESDVYCPPAAAGLPMTLRPALNSK